jgi:hypothetical protein
VALVALRSCSMHNLLGGLQCMCWVRHRDSTITSSATVGNVSIARVAVFVESSNFSNYKRKILTANRAVVLSVPCSCSMLTEVLHRSFTCSHLTEPSLASGMKQSRSAPQLVVRIFFGFFVNSYVQPLYVLDFFTCRDGSAM